MLIDYMHLFIFLANLIATIFMLLNLNAVMSIIFNVPAAVASTIVASRAVRRLTKFTNKGPEVFSYVLNPYFLFEFSPEPNLA